MRKNKNLKGQTLLEFALVFPILLLLVMGLFEFGRFVFYYSVLNNAVREGTRFAIVQPYEDYGAYPDETAICACTCSGFTTTAHQNICNEIRGKLFSVSELADTAITIEHDTIKLSETDTDGDPVVIITLEFDCQPIVPGLGLIGNLTIDVDSQMLLTAKAKNDTGG